jgi:peptidase E
VLYVAGGQAELIEPLYSQLTGLKDLLKGKVYIGCSMGAFMVSSQYVLTFDNQLSSEVHRGLGLLPIGTLCHWDIETKRQLKIDLLKRAAPDSPILTLNECKFTLFVD